MGTLLLAIAAGALGRGAPPTPDELDPGVTLRVYRVERDPESLPTLAPDQTPNFDERRPTVDFRDAAAFGDVPASFVSIVTGWIVIDTPGTYAFRLTSDDGSRLTLDGRLLIDHDGRHAATAQASRGVALAAGMHPLRIEHFDHGGQKRLTLEWRPPGSDAFVPVPAEVLRTERDLTRVTSPGFKRTDDDRRRAGDGKPVDGVHPAWAVTTIHPESFAPMVGAMAFASDGRLIVGTFNPVQRDDRALPDIDSKPPDKLYALEGVTSGDASRVTVRVAADGVYEPCGLCAVGDDLYVSHRKQITRLRDLDHDGFYETHEAVAEGWEAWNYHQFTFGLVHRDGRLYATLSTAMAPPGWEGMGTNAAPNGPMRGGVLEVDLSSNRASVIAGGTRAPNGIGLGPGGILLYLDNQGAWMPTSQLAEVIPGRFYGHHNRTNFVPNLAERFPLGGVPSVFCDRARTPAAVLLPHNELSNSPTQPQLIPSGPYAGQLYLGELTGGGIRRVCLERVNGQLQGAVFQFTQGLECGVNRLVWGPDGALYAGGIGAGGNWNWRGTRSGLQRLSPTGLTAFEMLAIRATPTGFEIEFTGTVDRAWLADAAHYTIKQWAYAPTAEYGGPKVGVEVLPVGRATPSEDGRRVTLEIPGLRAGRCVSLRTDPVSLRGEAIWSTEAWYTLNEIPPRAPARPATIAGRAIDPAREGVGVGVLPPAEGVPLIAASADPAFRRSSEAQLPREGGRSAEDLMALPGFVSLEKGSGDLITSTVLGDCRLHVEWLCPPGGTGQLAGNSGVYIQDLYEVQVLGTEAGDRIPGKDEAGSIYGMKAADANASTGPGTWQAYDVWFVAPRFENGRRTRAARLTMCWNGTLVHNDVEIPGPTGMRATGGEPGASATITPGGVQVGPLRLQNHESAAEGPVRFRNVWVAPLERGPGAPGEWMDLLRGAGGSGTDEVPSGWAVRGGAATFRLDAGEVVGTSRAGTGNTFLMTEREFGDFELLMEFKQDPGLNSGVQIRSGVTGGFENRSGTIRGPQVELDPSARAYTGGLYDESRRGWLHRLIDAPYARRAYRPGDWNRLRVTAEGPVVRTWINGVPAASIFDAMDERGRIGLQVHGVGEADAMMEVRFRDVRVRELNRTK
ncbi:MAG: DUF1080 domain-containing protein [Phycisphaerae bacterium]|nr:DUF1080 domain-containing protein [Phycisphaerae bacterium]